MTTRILEVTVKKVTRRGHTTSGNPIKVLHTDQGTLVTKRNAACVFAIGDGWSDKRVRLTLDTWDRVIGVEEGVTMPETYWAETKRLLAGEDEKELLADIQRLLEPVGDGTMKAEPGKAPDGRAIMGAEKIQPMTRRTGGVGAHGVYLEGRKEDGTVLRAFLAAEILGTSTLAAGAKGARWVLESHENAQVAQASLAGFFGSVEPDAVLVELTGQDVGRLRRSVLTSAVYPLQDILSNTVDGDWEEVT